MESKHEEERIPMKVFIRFAVLAGLVVGLAGLPAVAAQAQSAQKPQSGQQPAAQQQTGQSSSTTAQAGKATPAAPKVNPEEEKAYKKFFNTPATDSQTIITEGEAFLQKFPDSHYASAVYSRLATAYQSTGDETKMMASAKKAVELNPNNVDMLSLLAYVMPRRIDPNELGAADELKEAQGYATRALQLIPTVPKPAGLTDAQFAADKNGEESLAHSGLGLVDFYLHNIPGMITELEAALKLETTPDPADQFLLGFAYVQAGRYSDAVAPLKACSSTPNPVADRCKSALSVAEKHAASQPKAQPKS